MNSIFSFLDLFSQIDAKIPKLKIKPSEFEINSINGGNGFGAPNIPEDGIRLDDGIIKRNKLDQ